MRYKSMENNGDIRMRKIITESFMLIWLAVAGIRAQTVSDTTATQVRDSLMINDSIAMEYELKPVVILPYLYFSRASEWYAYSVIRRKVLKVYPFAKLAGENLEKLDARLSTLKGRKKRMYKKGVERYIRNVIEPQLKQLTVTEGRILVKLIHRQTGMTVYDFLKKYKSGLSAFWWQRMAKLYKIDLKSRFEPGKIKEDFWIEDILQRAFKYEQLEEQPAKIEIDYLGLYKKWMEKRPPFPKNIRKKTLLLQQIKNTSHTSPKK